MANLDLNLLDALCEPPPAQRLFVAPDHHDARRWEVRWEELCKLVAQPAWDKAADQWLERAERALADWPDAARVWPHAWLRRKVAPRATRLVRSLHLGDQSAPTHSAIFAQLATLDADTMPPLTELRAAYGRYNIKKQPTNMPDAPQSALLMERLALTPLAALYIIGGDSAPLWAALADAPAMATVRRFECSLYKNPHMTRAEYDAGIEGLLASPHASALEQLTLYGYETPRLSGLNLRAVQLIAAHHAQHLAWLKLPSCRGEQLEVLCGSRWPALRGLQSHDPMTLEQLAQRIDHAPALEELAVWHRLSGPPALAGQTTQLRALTLSHSGLDAAQVAALLSDPRLANVERLALHHLPLDAQAIGAISAMPLTRLHIEPPQLFALWPAMEGQRFDRLDTLTIEAGSMADLLSLSLPSLTRLALKLPRLTMEELDALEQAPWFAQLRGLSVAWFDEPGALKQRVQRMMQAINHGA